MPAAPTGGNFNLYPEGSDNATDLGPLFFKLREIMCCSTMIDGRFPMADFEKAPEKYLKQLIVDFSVHCCRIYQSFT